tara:strand:- start:1454 stop:1972 length:519 start_codon:yes stop_codon:yes gene_type:complete
MNKQFGALIGMFVVVILGVIFAGAIADETDVITNSQQLLNESVNMGAALQSNNDINESQNFTLAQSNWSTNTVVVNALNGTAFTLNTDYVVDYQNESIQLRNTTTVSDYLNSTSNFTGVDYNYFHSNYVEDAPSRVLVGLVLLFFVIGLLFTQLDKLKDMLRGMGLDDFMGK